MSEDPNQPTKSLEDSKNNEPPLIYDNKISTQAKIHSAIGWFFRLAIS